MIRLIIVGLSITGRRENEVEIRIRTYSDSITSVHRGAGRIEDYKLYLWFRQQREKGIQVTGPILLEKATEFHKLLYADSTTQFNASYGF